MFARILACCALLCLLAPPSARAAACKASNAGKCFTVRGRYAMYADGDRIWIIGTKRLLSGGDNRLDAMIQARGHWWDSVIYGDFAVCPLTPYLPGHLQTVCIQSYKNIKIAKRP